MFWQARQRNITLTWVLFAGFTALILAVVWAIDTFMGIRFGPGIYIIVFLFSAIGSLVTYWNSDKMVLRMTGARPLQEGEHPYLKNVVEGLSLAAGFSQAPKIYVIDNPTPNAFATGRDPQHSAIAVTSGLLDIMDREELRGVIAHEMSHVENRDVLIGTVAAVMASAIVLIARYTTWGMYMGGGRRRGGRDRNGNNGVMVVISLIVMLLAPLFAALLQAAISRRRELLADANSVRLTRNPLGLRDALVKISQHEQNMPVNDAVSSLFIFDPLRDRQEEGHGVRIYKLFSTHPPIEERIKRLEEM